MIYIIVGASCAGKTSFTKNSFIGTRECKEFKELITVTENENYYLIGNYLREGRTLGSDTVNRVDIPLIGPQVKLLLESDEYDHNKDIVLEGDKITSRPLFNFLLSLGVPIKLFLINVSPEISYERNMKNGSRCSFSHLKAVTHKALNIFNEYKDRMNGTMVDASEVSDFTTFSMYNYKEFVEESIW